MHAAHVSHFSFPDVTLRVLSDHYAEVLRNAAMKCWREEQYRKVGKDAYVSTLHIPAHEKTKHAFLTFHFHVAAGALVIIDSVTMQFLRGKDVLPHPDDAQLHVVIEDNQIAEVVFFYTTHVTSSHTFTSHIEHHDLEKFFSYIDEKKPKDGKHTYHWMHLITRPGEEAITFVIAKSPDSAQKVKHIFTLDKKEIVFKNTHDETDEIATESYIDALQSLLGMLPLNKI